MTFSSLINQTDILVLEVTFRRKKNLNKTFNFYINVITLKIYKVNIPTSSSQTTAEPEATAEAEAAAEAEATEEAESETKKDEENNEVAGVCDV